MLCGPWRSDAPASAWPLRLGQPDHYDGGFSGGGLRFARVGLGDALHDRGRRPHQGQITIEPDVLEYKLYAPKVGPVLVVGVSGGSGREQLVDLEDVGAKAARAAGTAPLGRPYP